MAMRFGIMAMQMDMLVPPVATPAEAAAYLAGFNHAGLVRTLYQRGFTLVELGGDLGMFFPNSFSHPAVEELAQLKAETGLSFTVHLPLWSVEPSTPLTPVRQGSVRAVVDTIIATRTLQPECYVLHATGALAAEFYQMRLPPQAKTLILRQFQQGARHSIQTILAETGLPSRRLAIETIEFPFELTLELADELDLSICLDTGHILVGFSGDVQLFDVLERVLPRLGEIHLHDGPWQGPERKIGYGKDHQALGSGDLDVARLLDRLVKARFSGPIIFELKINEALASLEVIRAIRPGLVE
jgi:sugar phosphate isomerase/epimerase